MKNTDLRAKARAIFGPAFAEPMPNQPNGAKALQQRANARPIPTYKVGGPVKKPTPAASAASGNRMSKQEGDEMRFMDMMEKKKKSAMPSPAASAASGNRMSRQEAEEMRRMPMKKGGKAGKYADGGMAEEITVEGRRPQNIDVDLNRMQGTTGGRMGPPAPSSGGGGGRGAAPMMEEPAPSPRSGIRLGTTNRFTGATADVGKGQMTVGFGPRRSGGISYSQPFKKGGEVQTSSDTARKLATEMGGMKKGGKTKPKDGLAVMIAIGKAKPTKKMNGGPMAARSADMEASKVTRDMAMGGEPMGYAAGGAGKMRKGQAPIKKAQGGAAKVRKGMMTPEGNITHAMNKMRGK